MDDRTYQDAVFYVMSGTGNTYRMACWAETIFKRHNVRSKIILIEDADFQHDFQPSSSMLVGILFPTHGFMPPWSMVKFLFKLPKGSGVTAMCGATRGAFAWGALTIPGASGFATFFTALLMFLKGFRVRALFSLDMPANMTNFHWGLHPKNIARLSKRSQAKLDRLLARILKGRTLFFTRNNLWEMLWSVGIFWLIPFFPILYLLIARLFMAKVMFANNRCVGCGMCARACPNKGIVMKVSGPKKVRPYWTYHCENCMRCMGYCKRKAVEAGHSWALLLYFATSVPMLTAFFAWLDPSLQLSPITDVQWLQDLFNLVYFFPAVMLSYGIFWYLIRFPLVNAIFAYTTLTRYYRRYHQPETRLKALMGHQKNRIDAP